MQLYNDHFQNFKRYSIPKAQLIIADIPFNLGNAAYASNPSWYNGEITRMVKVKRPEKAFSIQTKISGCRSLCILQAR